MTMKAARVHEVGGPEKIRFDDIPVPAPGPGEALVKVAAAGVNFVDTYHRGGLYKLDLPAQLGMEGAGTVEAVGADVQDVHPGGRVAWAMVRGSYAEYAVVPSWQLIPLPDQLDFKTAAAAMLQGMTAHYLTHSTFLLKPEHTCLVHAAAGGTGLLITQMAKMLGARVLGTVSSEEKARQARAAGVDDIILYTLEDFVEETSKRTGGAGVDVVYDSVGKSVFLKSLGCLRPRGVMVNFGNASGPAPAIEPLLLAQKGSLYLTRPNLAHYVAKREELHWRAGDVLRWVSEGRLHIHIGGEYRLDDAALAHRDLEGRGTTGKLILIP
jgi:NADPH2:quinone reductase